MTWRSSFALVCAGLIWLTGAALAAGTTDRERRQDAPNGARGRTTWDGVYTAEQAERGKALYAQSCGACHAPDLRGLGTAPSLVEESFAFLWGDMSVGELFEKIRKLMPSDRPSSLSSQTYRDIIAFILQSNTFPSGSKELDADVDALNQILIVTKRP